MKLAQRIMHLFNTRMASGILYELDMRLRPSGNSGLLVIHIDTFAQYQREEAWTWEHQALVRARTVFGYHELENKFVALRQEILTAPRKRENVREDVLKMRKKMREVRCAQQAQLPAAAQPRSALTCPMRRGAAADAARRPGGGRFSVAKG